MASEPFKSEKYTVARITNAIASDVQGNLIFSDVPNPQGVTLSQLIRGLIASNVSFSNNGTFFSGAKTVQSAIEQLNQFAYMNNTGRFIVVDPTISNELTVSGSIYNDIQTAVSYANTLITNGYNTVNVMLMGSHQQVAGTEVSSDLGVFEYDASTIEEIPLVKNGIKLIGVGRPTIRFKDISTLSNFFVVGLESTQELSVLIQDISFEFVNCEKVSAIKVVNSPNNSETKDKNGLFIDGVSASFVGGTNENNRIINVLNTSNPIKSNIKIKNINLGSVSGVTPSSTPIELVYVNHNTDTIVNIENMEFVNLDQPNPTNNVAVGNVTSITGIKIQSGKVFVNNAKLDEKMYWDNETFAPVKTLFLDSSGVSESIISNVSIVRDNYNTIEEKAGGITTLHDWIVVGNNAKVNAQGGFDEIFDVSVIPIPTDTPAPSGIPTTGAPTTGAPTTGAPTTGAPTTGAPTTGSGFLNDVKPVKGMYNSGDLAFGVGDKNELRLGIVDPTNIEDFNTYTRHYGIPLAINPQDRKLYFGLDGYLNSISGTSYTVQIKSSDWVLVGSDYEYTVNHTLRLTKKHAFRVSAFNTSDEMINLDKVVAINNNKCKVVMSTNESIWITIFS